MYVAECQEKDKDYMTFADFATDELTELKGSQSGQIETCLTMDDGAEYLLSLGLERRISQDETLPWWSAHARTT